MFVSNGFKCYQWSVIENVGVQVNFLSMEGFTKYLVDNFNFFVWALLRCFPLLKGSTNGHVGVTFQEFGQGIKTRLQNL